MHSKLLTLALTFLICSALSARAQVMIDFSKITCEQYVFSKVVPPTTVAVWLSGYYNGLRKNTKLDLNQFQKNADAVIAECKNDPKKTVMQIVNAMLSRKK